jgi:hypothetical protein
MQVSVADARCLDVHENLARTDLGNGYFFDAKGRAKLMNDSGFHVTGHVRLLEE